MTREADELVRSLKVLLRAGCYDRGGLWRKTIDILEATPIPFDLPSDRSTEVIGYRKDGRRSYYPY